MAFDFSTLFRRSAQRKTFSDLMKLDDHLLRDIGLTRSDLHTMMSGSRTARPRKVHGHE